MIFSIHPEKIMKTAIHETLSGRLWVKQQVQVKVNTIKHETQVTKNSRQTQSHNN